MVLMLRASLYSALQGINNLLFDSIYIKFNIQNSALTQDLLALHLGGTILWINLNNYRFFSTY